MMQRHVLFFVPSLDAGGAETHVIRLANHLDRRRFRVSVVLARGQGALQARLAPDVRCVVLNPGPSRFGSIVGLFRSAPALARLLKRERPDVVCSFMEHASVVALYAASRAGLGDRVVVGIQNTMSRSMSPRGNARDLTRWLTRSAVESSYHRPARLVALSRGVGEDAVHMFPYLQGRVRVIYNAGADDSVVRASGSASEVERPRDAVLFLACGRLDYQKGYPYLLEAFARVRQRFESHLWIIGKGPDRERLETQARSLGIEDRVRFLGFQSNPYAYMAAADVFVLPSLYEGFANVVTEAMACGAPVLATDCPHGPGEIIEPEQSGVLVPPADTEALAAAMSRLGGDRELRLRLAANAPRRAARFHASVIAAEYGELFEAVAESRPSGSDRHVRVDAVLPEVSHHR